MKEWRSKNRDLILIKSFDQNLNEFKRMKLQKWEKIDEQVQKSINPGTPSEDWIIPPDENKTLDMLNQDLDYLRLRKNITEMLPAIKSCAKFLMAEEHHEYDWIKFTNPLIGNSALDDAITRNQQLLQKAQSINYFWKNLANCFRF
ncbi:hypothetical protein PHSC3_002001 [Chlamydiales bacterium STE3]|nr:hypothetical protein PHSC3_002001 [Chlamydiales bacterium STE3]